MPTTAESAQLAAINKQAILQNKSAKNHAKPTRIIHSHSMKSAMEGHGYGEIQKKPTP